MEVGQRNWFWKQRYSGSCYTPASREDCLRHGELGDYGALPGLDWGRCKRHYGKIHTKASTSKVLSIWYKTNGWNGMYSALGGKLWTNGSLMSVARPPTRLLLMCFVKQANQNMLLPSVIFWKKICVPRQLGILPLALWPVCLHCSIKSILAIHKNAGGSSLSSSANGCMPNYDCVTMGNPLQFTLRGQSVQGSITRSIERHWWEV